MPPWCAIWGLCLCNSVFVLPHCHYRLHRHDLIGPAHLQLYLGKGARMLCFYARLEVAGWPSALIGRMDTRHCASCGRARPQQATSAGPSTRHPATRGPWWLPGKQRSNEFTHFSWTVVNSSCWYGFAILSPHSWSVWFSCNVSRDGL